MADIELVIKIPETLKKIADEEDYRAFSHPVWLAILMESIQNGTPLTESDDCVNRAELLKAIDTWDKFGFEHTGCFVREPKDDFITYVHYDDVIKCIKGMPSVQPKSIIINGDMSANNTTEQIIWERDTAIQQLKDLGYGLGEKPRKCADCVSREAVINAIYKNGVWENEYNLTSSRIKKAVEELPSVQPKRDKGEWIAYHLGAKWICSKCNEKNNSRDYFCPNCGAKMESEDKE